MLRVATIEDIEGFHAEQMAMISDLKNEIASLNRSDSDRLVSRKELAHFLGVSESTIDNMRRKGIIKSSYEIGIGEKRGKPKFRISEVLEAVKNKSTNE